MFGYWEVSGWKLAFSQNPIRFVKRDCFVSDSLFPFPSSSALKSWPREDSFIMEWLYSILFLKWNLFVVSIWGTQLTTLLSTSLLLFTSSPLLIAILKDQNVIEEDRIQEKKYRFFMFQRLFIYPLSKFYKKIKDDIFYKRRKITKGRRTPNIKEYQYVY